MTDDERFLRRWAAGNPDYGIKSCAPSKWAVDEIDKLRNALKPFATRDLKNVCVQDTYDARKALGLDPYE